MHCEEAEALLGRLVFDELEESDKVPLREHVESCAACRELAGDMRVAAKLLGEGIELETPVLTAERKEKLARVAARAARFAGVRSATGRALSWAGKHRRHLRLSGAAAAVLACAFVVYGLFAPMMKLRSSLGRGPSPRAGRARGEMARRRARPVMLPPAPSRKPTPPSRTDGPGRDGRPRRGKPTGRGGRGGGGEFVARAGIEDAIARLRKMSKQPRGPAAPEVFSVHPDESQTGTVVITGDNFGDGGLGRTLTFDSADWNMPQRVVVEGAGDSLKDGRSEWRHVAATFKPYGVPGKGPAGRGEKAKPVDDTVDPRSIAWWNLDGAGQTAMDSVGNGNNGALTNMAGTEWKDSGGQVATKGDAPAKRDRFVPQYLEARQQSARDWGRSVSRPEPGRPTGAGRTAPARVAAPETANQVAVQGRFLEIREGFFEDIGVDFGEIPGQVSGAGKPDKGKVAMWVRPQWHHGTKTPKSLPKGYKPRRGEARGVAVAPGGATAAGAGTFETFEGGDLGTLRLPQTVQRTIVTKRPPPPPLPLPPGAQRGNLRGETTLGIYDVRDLTEETPDFAGPELIMRAGRKPGEKAFVDVDAEAKPTSQDIARDITRKVTPEGWAPELGTSIEERSGKLVVMGGPEQHKAIERHLKERRAKAAAKGPEEEKGRGRAGGRAVYMAKTSDKLARVAGKPEAKRPAPPAATEGYSITEMERLVRTGTASAPGAAPAGGARPGSYDGQVTLATNTYRKGDRKAEGAGKADLYAGFSGDIDADSPRPDGPPAPAGGARRLTLKDRETGIIAGLKQQRLGELPGAATDLTFRSDTRRGTDKDREREATRKAAAAYKKVAAALKKSKYAGAKVAMLETAAESFKGTAYEKRVNSEIKRVRNSIMKARAASRRGRRSKGKGAGYLSADSAPAAMPAPAEPKPPARPPVVGKGGRTARRRPVMGKGGAGALPGGLSPNHAFVAGGQTAAQGQTVVQARATQQGILDDARVYSGALSASDIKKLRARQREKEIEGLRNILGERREGAAAARSRDLADVGKRFSHELQYVKARDALQRAVVLDPTNKEAAQRLEKVNDLLGVRMPSIRSSLEALSRERQVAIQPKLIGLEDSLRRAAESIERSGKKSEGGGLATGARDWVEKVRDADRAIADAERAKEIIKWMPTEVDTKEQRSRADRLLVDARNRRAQALAELRKKKASESLTRLQRGALEEQKLEEAKIGRLTDQVQMLFDNEEFDRAEKLAKKVLEINPTDKDAAALLARSRQKRHELAEEDLYKRKGREGRKAWQIIEEAAIPYSDSVRYPKDWERIRRRVEIAGETGPRKEARLKQIDRMHRIVLTQQKALQVAKGKEEAAARHRARMEEAYNLPPAPGLESFVPTVKNAILQDDIARLEKDVKHHRWMFQTLKDHGVPVDKIVGAKRPTSARQGDSFFRQLKRKEGEQGKETLAEKKARLEKELHHHVWTKEKMMEVGVPVRQIIFATEARPMAPIYGTVLAVRPEVNLVMLNLGSDDNVEKGYRFTIYDGERYVGKVEVERPFSDMCSARILPDWTKEEIREGYDASTALGGGGGGSPEPAARKDELVPERSPRWIAAQRLLGEGKGKGETEREPAAIGDAERRRQIAKKLDRKVSFEFADTPLSEALQSLQTLTKTRIDLDAAALKGAAGKTPITLKVTDMSLGLALDWVLKLADMDYAVSDLGVLVSTPERLGTAAPELPPEKTQAEEAARKRKEAELRRKREEAKRLAEAKRKEEEARRKEEEAARLAAEEAAPPPPVNPFVLAARDRLSTFALDTDTASYTIARNYIRRGRLPPPVRIRMEEFVNAFDYNYPTQAKDVFNIHAEGTGSPFGRGLYLLKLGVQAKVLGREGRKPAHLVFVVDTSGSMEKPDRLPLVKLALGMLVGELSGRDRVSLITYGTQARLVLEAVAAAERKRIHDTIASLQCGGSTNLHEGVKLGYEIAKRHFRSGDINRVILCSDGVANVGSAVADDIVAKAEMFRGWGVTLTTAGFGAGSYNDEMLEKLANSGDGNYVFIDSEAEARRVFVEQMSATLQTVAKDAKVQVEFDPRTVRRYRLVGYENRAIKDKQFRDDTVDAGEVGSGQAATALYEIELVGRPVGRPKRTGDLGTVYVRYKNIDTGKVEEISKRLGRGLLASETVKGAPRLFLAACAAEFAEVLRGSEHARGAMLGPVERVLVGVASELPLDGKVAELFRLVQRAKSLRGER